jgi:hypothetical protein
MRALLVVAAVALVDLVNAGIARCDRPVPALKPAISGCSTA